ncbi:MAG: flagellar biosynthetic protein FliO [Desulfobacterales bacterium]|jgi:flagellar protein FliO/FliZ|nr:flagellar biosynthetic protein FliO [Desulfobacterales bacterium]
MDAVSAEPVVTLMPELWMTLLKSFGMLCVVLGVLITVLWLLRRLHDRGLSGQPGLIQVVASSYVGPKERISLVDVLGEKFLIGVTSQEINLLAKISDKDNVCAERSAAPEGLFKSLLRRQFDANAGAGEKGKKGSSAG